MRLFISSPFEMHEVAGRWSDKSFSVRHARKEREITANCILLVKEGTQGGMRDCWCGHFMSVHDWCLRQRKTAGNVGIVEDTFERVSSRLCMFMACFYFQFFIQALVALRSKQCCKVYLRGCITSIFVVKEIFID